MDGKIQDVIPVFQVKQGLNVTRAAAPRQNLREIITILKNAEEPPK
jgi:hypothetical protein